MPAPTARQQRTAERLVHLLAATALLAYVYIPLEEGVDDLVRFVVFPVLTLTGMAMWQVARIRRAARALRRVTQTQS